jgi:hypothetical protein
MDRFIPDATSNILAEDVEVRGKYNCFSVLKNKDSCIKTTKRYLLKRNISSSFQHGRIIERNSSKNKVALPNSSLTPLDKS